MGPTDILAAYAHLFRHDPGGFVAVMGAGAALFVFALLGRIL